MKKLKFVAVFVLAICLLCSSFIFSACGNKSLESPTNISINDDYRLSWAANKEARSYTIKVTHEDGQAEEHTSRRAYYSLANLAEGNYIINVKAISGSKNYTDSAWSNDYEFEKDYESGCLYTLINNNTEYEVTRVGTASGTVILGDTYRKKPVTSIADSAFKGSGRVEKIVIGSYVKTIGESAFFNCTKLSEIIIPESVMSIGTSAFHNCSQLNSIDLPSGLKTIEPYTFAYCRALKSIELPDVTVIGESAFSYCDSLTSISIPDTVINIEMNAFIASGLESVKIGAGVETIGKSAFYRNKALSDIAYSENSSLTTIEGEVFGECTSLVSVTVPEGVTDLNSKAFYGCTNLESIDLPDSLMHVGESVFGGTKIYADSVAQGEFVYADNWLVAWTGSSNNEVKEKLTQLNTDTLKSGVVGIADQVFLYSHLESIILPRTLRVIGRYAFAYNESLWQVYTYENRLTEVSDLKLIDEMAFLGCTLLDRLHLNKGLEKIKRYAFYNCERLVNDATGESLIPNTVTSIGVAAFENTKLYNDQKGVVYAGDWVVDFNGNKSNGGAILGANISGLDGLPVRGIADYAFYNDGIIGSIRVTNSSINTLKYVGLGAFRDCTYLQTVFLGLRVEEIAPYTFYNCQSLVNFDFTNYEELTTIGRSAFYNCVSLPEIDLSDSRVSYIGPYAFFNCSSLSEIDLGNDIETIDERAFYKCISVEEIEIPDTVTTIGERAFYHCEGLKTLSLGKNVKTIGNNAFSGCTGLTSLTIPDSVETIGNYAFYKCSGITSLKLGSGVKSIGNYAFAYLSSIKSLYLPQSVESIGRYAFMRCEKLCSVTFNSEIALDMFSFYGCAAMTAYIEATELPDNWHERWNPSFRPVVWGCELSEDGSYLVSFTISENTFTNIFAKSELDSPNREGYAFMGWTTQAGSSEAEFKTSEILDLYMQNVLEIGTKVYAVWQELTD